MKQWLQATATTPEQYETGILEIERLLAIKFDLKATNNDADRSE